MNLNLQANNYLKNTSDIENLELGDRLLEGVNDAGLNNLIFFFLNVASSNNIYLNSIEHYDLREVNFQQKNLEKLNLQKYIVELADQITFESDFSIAFASHFSRTLVFHNNTLIMFNTVVSPTNFSKQYTLPGDLLQGKF
jgi:hypothetical protein